MRINDKKPVIINGAGRMRLLLAAIAALAGVVFARVLALELWYGDEYREVASRPIERIVLSAAARGRILAKDGTVLAYDREAATLAIHYRYLEQPADSVWLRREARRRLPRKERRDAARVDEQCRRVEADRSLMHERLAGLCGLSDDQYGERLQAVQRRIERIAQSVRSRRQNEKPAQRSAEGPFWRRFLSWLDDERTADGAASLSVAEEYEYHPVFVGLTLDAVAEIEGCPERYPGARIVTWRQRVYPQQSLAAHVVGYVPDAAADLLLAGGVLPSGQQGVERQYDKTLQGTPGVMVESSDRSGRLLARHVERAAESGRDLRLTIDPPLQRTAEELLDQALERRTAREGAGATPAGGAIVVFDVESGALACAASAPRFEPETMARGTPALLERLFADPAKPLFDRPSQMGLPPGSVFKALSAIALVEAGVIEPARPFDCQGYLTSPEKERCQIFRQSQVGHGPLKLADALARSCNVYFFHHAAEAGPAPIIEWAERFRFGRPTGVDLPDEAAGSIPTNDAAAELTRDDALALAIGQGTLTATPLQIARLMAAIANGGRLITPHVAVDVNSRVSLANATTLVAEAEQADVDLPLVESAVERCPGGRTAGASPRQSFTGKSTTQRGSAPATAPHGVDDSAIELDGRTLAVVRRGLELVVADPEGTGYDTVRLESIEIAGKTGTAETAAAGDHAWFAGYVPAQRPRYAFTVVIEHGGGGAEVAGPVARRLVQKMQSLGYFARRSRLASPAAIPRAALDE
jgi:penicillin-binding protein 2